jgi:hypothetical protein
MKDPFSVMSGEEAQRMAAIARLIATSIDFDKLIEDGLLEKVGAWCRVTSSAVA